MPFSIPTLLSVRQPTWQSAPPPNQALAASQDKDSPLKRSPATPEAAPDISEKARSLLEQEQTVSKPPLSRAQMQELYAKTHGPYTWLDVICEQINTLGLEAPMLNELPDSTDPQRLEQARQAAAFVFESHHNGTTLGCPFNHLSRQALCDIISDESGEHTTAERYAAKRTRSEMDFNYLCEIGRFDQNGNRPLSSRGLLAYHDALSPIERSIHSDSYRAQYVRNVHEDEQLHGKSNLPIPLWILLLTQPSPRKSDPVP